MTIRYEINLLEGDFEGAEHDVRLEFEDNEVQIQAGYERSNYATLTLQQFERVAIEVERFKKMRTIESLDSGDF